jgi:hypothetical protein
MAYLQNNYGFSNPLDDEEERKRREAAAMADEAVASGGGMRGPMSFGDIAGQAFDRRMSSAQDRIGQAAQIFTDPEEALRRRLGAQQQEAIPEPTPVKQTITTDPQTGEQKIKIEGSARDLSAANPLTPTVTGPVAPIEQREAPPAPQMMQQQQQPVANQQRPVVMQQPLPSQGPISPEMAAMPVAQPRLPQPGPAIQMASAAPGLPQTQQTQQPRPAVPGLAALPTLAQMGQAAQQAPTPPAPPAQPAWIQAANDASNDFNKLLDVAAKYPESRDVINDKLMSSFKNKSKEDEANQLFKDAASGDLKAQNKIFQSIKPETGKQKEEVTVNDYVKAYMYKRLGLDDLARDVQNKILGKETLFSQMTVGNSNWQVETDKQGNIIRAKDDEGNFATTATLNKLRATGQKFGQQAFSTTGGSVTIPAGQPDAGEEYRTVFNSTSGKFENKIITGKNAGNTYTGPAGLEKRVATNAATALNDAFIKYQSAPSTAAATEMAKTASLLGPAEYSQALQFIQRTTPQIFGQIQNTLPSAPGQPNIAQTAPAPTSYVNPAQADPGALRRAQGDIQSLTNELTSSKYKLPDAKREADRVRYLNDEMAKAQQRLQQAQQSQQAPNAPVSPAQVQAMPTQPSGGGLLQQTEQVKANVAVGQNLEEQKNKVRMTLPSTELNASTMLNTLNDIMTHPGLDKTIGNPLILNTPLALIPQSDRREFKQKYQQLAGQEFLAAFAQLKGGGSITEVEGLKAEQAISALKDTGISPAEFKKNAWILQDVVKRGIDSQRTLVGQPPKYAESPDREEAKEWLRNNPNHPKAAGVRMKLVGF